MKTFLAIFFIIFGAYFCYCTGLVKGQEEQMLKSREIADIDRTCGIDLNTKKIILIQNILALQQAIIDLESEIGL